MIFEARKAEITKEIKAISVEVRRHKAFKEQCEKKVQEETKKLESFSRGARELREAKLSAARDAALSCSQEMKEVGFS